MARAATQLPAVTQQTGALSDQDRAAARLALVRYRLDLLEEATTLSAPSLQALNQGMLSLGASICGSTIAVKLGVAVAVAGAVSSAAVALVALGYGVLTISRGASAYRRRNILKALARRLATIEDHL